jgi:hypothetical protein
MVMVNAAVGATIGAMIRAAGCAATVRLDDDAISVVFSSQEKDAVREKPAKAKNPEKKKRRSRKDLVTAGGKTLSIEDWAKREKVSIWTICYRMDKHGSPLGPKKPTNKDKIILGS